MARGGRSFKIVRPGEYAGGTYHGETPGGAAKRAARQLLLKAGAGKSVEFTLKESTRGRKGAERGKVYTFKARKVHLANVVEREMPSGKVVKFEYRLKLERLKSPKGLSTYKRGQKKEHEKKHRKHHKHGKKHHKKHGKKHGKKHHHDE